MRDITLEETIYCMFSTRAFASGVPTSLLGTPVLSVLESNNATPITAGVSVNVDRASVTGLNQATIVATAANGYEAGKSYACYISTGTVGGVSVVGEVVAEFTVQASAAFTRIGAAGAGLTAITGVTLAASQPGVTIPTVTTLTGHTAQTGDAFARLGAPAGASVSADVAAVKVDTAAILVDTGTTLDARIPAALVGGRMDSSVGAMAAGVVTAAAIATDAIDADALAADAVTEIQAGLATPTNITAATGVALAASQHVIVDSGTITTYTGNTPQTADVSTLITTVGVAGAGLTVAGVTGVVSADVKKVNAITVTGSGTTIDPWSPV